MRRRTLRIGLAAGALALLAAGYGVSRMKRYIDTDPAFCAQCHRASPEFALWAMGTHRGVACQRCHHNTPEQGLAMLRAFLAGKKPEGDRPHNAVEIGACASCHLSHDPQWRNIEGSRGHRVHVERNHIACITCHAKAMHRFEPVVASCKECHGAHTVREAGMEKLHCFACHDFLSSEPGLRPTRRDCLRCHRAEGILPARFPADAPMQFECGTCHKPHARTKAEERVGCETCHVGMRRAGLHGAPGHGDCGSCHAAHGWRAGQDACARCHARRAAHAEGSACATCHAFGGATRPVPPRPL
jgi:hypothetical protein